MPKQNFRCRIPLNSSMTSPSGKRTPPTKVGPPWRHRCRSCCSSKDLKRWRGRWGWWGRDRNHDQNNSWVSNMLWHADVSSLFWFMAVKVDGRSRTQNQEKNMNLLCNPWEQFAIWVETGSLSALFRTWLQTGGNANQTLRLRWLRHIETHWDIQVNVKNLDQSNINLITLRSMLKPKGEGFSSF